MRKPTMSTLISNTTKSTTTTTPCCTKVGLKRGPWTPEEDKVLSDFINKEGEGRWRTLPKRAGLLRCGKSCRLRWMNYLRPSVKRGQIAPDEEDLILRLHRLLGNRWSLIAGRIPGRTDNEIKNFWNTHLSKKLISQGIDPRTHKPLTNTVITTDDDHQLMVTTSAVSPSATTAQKNDRNNASNCLVPVVNGRGSAATATSSSDIISSAIGRLVEHHHASDGSPPLQLFQSYVHDNDDHFQAEMIDNGNNNFLNHHSNNINGDDTQDHQCTDDEIINYSCGGEDVFSTFLNSLINEDDVFINNTGQMVHVQHPVQHNQFMQANHQQPILTDDMISVNPLAHESDKSSFGFVDGSNAATSNNIDGNWGMINAATLMSAPGNTVFGEQSCGRRFTDEHDDDHQRQF